MPTKGKKMSLAHRAKLSAAHRRPATRAKHRAAMQRVYADPAYGAKLSAIQYARWAVRIQTVVAAYPDQYPPGYADLVKLTRPEDRERRSYARYLWLRFRATVEDVARLYDAQGRRCGWCRRPIGFGRGQRAPLGVYVDHDHRNDRVRGLLCNRCNRFLGILEGVHGSGLFHLIRYLQATDPMAPPGSVDVL